MSTPPPLVQSRQVKVFIVTAFPIMEGVMRKASVSFKQILFNQCIIQINRTKTFRTKPVLKTLFAIRILSHFFGLSLCLNQQLTFIKYLVD